MQTGRRFDPHHADHPARRGRFAEWFGWFYAVIRPQRDLPEWAEGRAARMISKISLAVFMLAVFGTAGGLLLRNFNRP